MSDRWVAIQRNPNSGSGPRRALLLELVAGLKSHGLRPRIFSSREKLQARLEIAAHRATLVGIVAAGGDGTVSDILNRYPDLPVAVLPLGTENLLARYLGIPRSGRFVAEMVAAGETHRFDVGNAGGRRFSLMASCGFDADILQRTHSRRRGHITKWSYLQPIYDSLRKYKYPEMRVYLDGAESATTCRLAVIANLPVYALGLPFARAARGDDGLLDVRLFKRHSAFQMFRYLYMVSSGKHEQISDVICVQARQIRIEGERVIPVQLDGDPAGGTPIEINVEPNSCELFVPSSFGTR